MDLSKIIAIQILTHNSLQYSLELFMLRLTFYLLPIINNPRIFNTGKTIFDFLVENKSYLLDKLYLLKSHYKPLSIKLYKNLYKLNFYFNLYVF